MIRVIYRPAKSLNGGPTVALPVNSLDGVGRDIGFVWSAPFIGKWIARTQTVPSETCFHTDRAGGRWLLLVQEIALGSRPGLTPGDAPDASAHRLGGAT
jgi:hypothetical protein